MRSNSTWGVARLAAQVSAIAHCVATLAISGWRSDVSKADKTRAWSPPALQRFVSGAVAPHRCRPILWTALSSQFGCAKQSLSLFVLPAAACLAYGQWGFALCAVSERFRQTRLRPF